ncbi:MAG: SufS family cysteine desulfurase [Verrucomicrobiales bacterium]|nr:SufS family cysteine desulfurase [Verrucomicrobiales bacterium]
MSTLDPLAAAHPRGLEPSGGELETELIVRLAREVLGHSPTQPIAPASADALVANGAKSAAAPVGWPSPGGGLPKAEWIQATQPAGVAKPHHELSGGYPRASAPTHPPVHPVLRAGPNVAAKPAVTPPASGGHDPTCGASYAFGEPRCHQAVAPRSGSGIPSSAVKRVPTPDLPGTARSAALDTPESGLYFVAPNRPPATQALPTPVPKPWLALDVESIRRDFPALHQNVNGRPLIWLDNAATTHKPNAVIDAMSRFYQRDNSNIHRAAHALAARATDLFEDAREKVREFLGASSASEIVFVRGTTEAINLVAQAYGRSHLRPGDEILLTRMEHHANIVPWQMLAQQTGAVIRVAPINEHGELILETLVDLIQDRTKLVALTHVSNALGTINPIEEVIAAAHARGAKVLVDGAQSTPHLPVNVRASDADFYVFSGHKIFGPTGIGALYGKADVLESMTPWQGGGHMIRDVTFERTLYQSPPERFEAGTPDIAGAIGLGAAVEYLQSIGLPAIAAYEHSLHEYAERALSTIPGLRRVGSAATKASILGFVIPGIPNEVVARHLDKHGIAVRAGHHCAQPAVRHFGLEGTVRPSLAFYNTFAEVDALVEALERLPRPSRQPQS